MSNISEKKENKQFLLSCFVGIFIGVCSAIILGQSDSFFAEFPAIFNFFIGFISVIVPAFAVMLPTPEN
ncbi:hypothetical protein EOL94_01170 [bacterium]|nr:hypothetical protein [bacterium]